MATRRSNWGASSRTISWRAARRASSAHEARVGSAEADSSNLDAQIAIVSVHPLATPPVPRGPLAGVGVIITRPARQSAGLARQLAALDAIPIVFPAVVILPPANRAALDRAHASLGEFDIAIFVSANAVEYGAPAPDRWPPALLTIAPGPGTAAALAATGRTEVLIPASTFDTEGMLALPAMRDVQHRRVVIFRGEGGRGELGEGLRSRGAQVTYVDCYRRAAPITGSAGLSEVLRESRAHALTLTSSEGLDNLCALLDTADLGKLRELPAFVPHPRIAEHARELGFAAVETGGADSGLVAGLLEWFAAHPLA
jgi:uroporphyrinogen-III synthase